MSLIFPQIRSHLPAELRGAFRALNDMHTALSGPLAQQMRSGPAIDSQSWLTPCQLSLIFVQSRKTKRRIISVQIYQVQRKRTSSYRELKIHRFVHRTDIVSADLVKMGKLLH